MFALVAKISPLISRYLAALVFVASFAGAQSVANAKCVNGTASISVYGLDEGDEPDNADIKKAKAKSMMAAWTAFAEKMEVPLLRAYMQNKDKVLGELNFYVRENFSYKYDPDSEKIIGKNCITVDMERLKASLNIKDKPEPIASGEGSSIVILFVARQAVSEKVFDATRKTSASATAGVQTSAAAKSKSKSAAKEQSMASGGKAISMTKQKSKSKSKTSTSVTSTANSESSGSTLRRSNETRYKVISGKAANGALAQPLSKAGYEPSIYEFVAEDEECRGPSVAAIKETFTLNDELTAKQLRGAARASRKCEAKYFVVGTMTADVARTHQSGMKMVIVRVQGTVYDISRRLPRMVAPIPPKQYPGLAPNEDAARTNALTLAGKKAGEVITAMMREKGLR